MIIRGRHYLLDEIYDFDCADGRIAAIRRPDGAAPALGGDNCWVVPGLVDLQVNGCAGVDFCAAGLTPEGVEAASAGLAAAGVTAYLPTVITGSAADIASSVTAIDRACAAGGAAGARILGIHLEGPYISPVDGPRGAHPAAHVRLPDWDEFCRWQAAAGGRIRLVTLAPELPGARDFIARARAAGVVVALGHHSAGREEIDDAVAAGATLSTHLGNGSHAQLARHPNYIWEQLANDALLASMIVDGHHLPPSVVKAFYRVKGPGRLILVSDMIWLAGMPAGGYQFAGREVTLGADGSVRLAGTAYLGGSTLRLIDALNNVMAFAAAPLADAVRMAAQNPADLAGATDRGRLAPSSRADLLLLAADPTPAAAAPRFRLYATIAGGEVVFADQTPAAAATS